MQILEPSEVAELINFEIHFALSFNTYLLAELDATTLSILFLQAETTVINQCTQLLSPSAEPNYVMTYLSHSFPQHRQYLCAGAWILMQGHPENINSANLVLQFGFFLLTRKHCIANINIVR